MKKFQLLLLVLVVFSKSSTLFSQVKHPPAEENVIYGMVSGAALLMDIYRPPSNSNNTGIIIIPGSAFGFSYPENYNQQELKNDYFLDTAYLSKWAKDLVKRGYTVFVINHRFCPQFKYADIISDCRRAVRFVRVNAKKYGIDPAHIGAVGHSSGGCLAAMLGTTDETIINSKSNIDSCSSKVQAVVTLAAPFDLSDYNKSGDSMILTSFALKVMEAYMGKLPELNDNGDYMLSGKFADASPIAQVTKDDAPFLIYYSDNDPIIPPRQAVAMYEKLKAENVEAEKRLSKNTGHNPVPDMSAIDGWFKKYLKSN